MSHLPKARIVIFPNGDSIIDTGSSVVLPLKVVRFNPFSEASGANGFKAQARILVDMTAATAPVVDTPQVFFSNLGWTHFQNAYGN
jgi:hypothetical protein